MTVTRNRERAEHASFDKLRMSALMVSLSNHASSALCVGVIASFWLGLAAPAAAQSRWFAPVEDAPTISLRPFVMTGGERFAATKTFNAVFGQDTATWWGGGVDAVFWRGRIFAEVDASRLLKSKSTLVGERVFVNGADVFKLGIPLRARIEPLDVTAGIRFNGPHRYVPYVGGGLASYHYTEESDFAAASENLDARHAGPIVHGGVEVRVSRWIGATLDVRYSQIKGILGTSGASNAFGEDNLGGTSVRAKLVVGR